MDRRLAWIVAGVAACAAAVVDIRPAVRTAQVANDPDDPAVWLNPADPGASLVVGTNKVAAPGGALVVFGLDGAIRQTVSGLDRPNNVDIEYGLRVGGRDIDIAVATERLKNRLRVFRIDASGLADATAPDSTGGVAEPMGIALYKRPRDGTVFAIVAPKTGPREGYLRQFRLGDAGGGKVRATLVRQFGRFSGTAEIEAVAVDDPLGFVYYADERDGIHKYHADPDHPDAARELAHFGTTGFRADREGIAIHQRPDGTGFIVCTDQIAGNSEYHLFKREGEPGRPHDHREVRVVRGGADSTDGLEIFSGPLGPRFPHGVMVAMNSSGRNFLLFRLEDVVGR
jgi:3-phytase